jgi:SPP1 family predicted phage head-tail adaptor
VTVYRDSRKAAPLPSGERPEDPQVVARNLPAEVLQLSGRELERARQLVADVTHQVTIRYRADVTARCWLVWNGSRLDNESALAKETETVCLCVGPA